MEKNTAGRWVRLRQWTTWQALAVAFGLGLRCFHYLRNPSVWGDEAVVMMNVLQKNFAQLFGGLTHAEAAPPLFLWLEKGCLFLLGDAPFAWRLAPFLASCAALLLLAPIARRLLTPAAAFWALLLFASSDKMLWHTCEAKPYALDVLAAVVLLCVYSTARSWPLSRQLLLYGLLAPLLIFCSFPGCFLCGGLLVALLPAVWRAKHAGTWAGYAALALVIHLSFLVLLLGPIRSQHTDPLVSFWESQLAQWDKPWTIPAWAAAATYGMFRYCCEPTGGFLALLAGIGGVTFWRTGRRDLLCLLVVPVLLALAAALMRHYPFGHARLELYATPAVLLLVGAGLPPTFAWLRARGRLGVAAAAPLVLCLLLPPALAVYRVVVPWERPDAVGAFAYIQAHRRPADLLATDHWVYEYLSQGRAISLQSLPSLPSSPEARVWVVAEGDESMRSVILSQAPMEGWKVVERRDDFMRTTILLLVKQAPPHAAEAEEAPRASGRPIGS